MVGAMIAAVTPAQAQDSNNPYNFEKKAYKPDGTPWAGPVNVGDTVKYVLSYKPGTTPSGPVTIDDQLSSNLSYVGPTTSSPGWTWGSSPYVTGNKEKYVNPSFGPGGSVKISVSGPPLPVTGSGDGTIPVPILSLGKVFGVYHHSTTSIDCWNLSDLTKCGSPQSGGGLNTPLTPQSVVRGTRIFYAAYRSSGQATFGCFDGASNSACADTPVAANVSNYGQVGGVVEDSAGRLFLGVKEKLFCMTESGGTLTPCSGWPASGLTSVTTSPSSFGAGNDIYLLTDVTAPNRIYAHHGLATVQCIDTSAIAPCVGWSPAGVKFAGKNRGTMLSSLPLSGGTGDGGVCLWDYNGPQVGCVSNTGSVISSTPTGFSGGNIVPISSFRVPGTGKVFFPDYNFDGPECIDYSGTTGTSCPGYPTAWTAPYSTTGGSGLANGTQYGFALDPQDPSNCMLALGHNNMLWRFEYKTGKLGCSSAGTLTPPIDGLFCHAKPDPKKFQWTGFTIPTASANGTLSIMQGTTSVFGGPVVANGNYSFTAPPDGSLPLSVSFTPTGSSPSSVEVVFNYNSDANPEICYQAVVKECGVVSNTALMKGAVPAAFSASQTVKLGKAAGPNCEEIVTPPKFSCLSADPKVSCGKTPGTFVVTLSPNSTGSTSPSEFEVTVLTPGVTIQNAQASYIIGPSGQLQLTLVGASPGDVIELEINGSQLDPKSKDGMSICCVDKIKITIPKNLDCWKPTLSVTKDCDPPVEGPTGLAAQCRITVKGTNLLAGVPVTVTESLLGSGTLTALGAANSSHPWTCDPVTAPSPQKCVIDGGALMSVGGTSVINATVTFPNSGSAEESKNCAAGGYTSATQNGGAALDTPPDCDDFGGLKIEKRFTDFECSVGGSCKFEIVITNTSQTKPFNGPYAISEDMNGVNLQIASVTPPLCTPSPTQTPFACVANLNIPAGGSQTYTFDSYLPMGSIPVGDTVQTLENCVKSAGPPPSTSGQWWSNYFETVPSQKACAETVACGFLCHMSEDSASKLVVQKTLKSQACRPGSNCTYTITVTNTGTASVSSPLTLTEIIPTGSSLVSVNSLPWSCAPDGTPSQLGCTYPPTTLNAGASLSFDIVLAIPANFAGSSIKNCVAFETAGAGLGNATDKLFSSRVKAGSAAEITDYLVARGLAAPAAKELAARHGVKVGAAAAQRTGALSCVETPVGNLPQSNLKIEKKGPENCEPNTPCDFTIKVTSVGRAFNGDVLLFDAVTPNPWNVLAITPNVCGALPTTTPFGCVAKLNLQADVPFVFKVTLNTPGAGALRDENCMAIGLAPDGLVKDKIYNKAELESLASQGALMQGNLEQSCFRFPVEQEAAKLACDSRTAKLVGSACRCTLGSMVPVSKTACACPDGTTLRGGICVKPPPKCDGATASARGNECVCRFPRMNKVSSTACRCADGFDFKVGKGCVRKPPVCRDGTRFNAKRGRCEPLCPKGTQYNVKRNICERPVLRCDRATTVANGNACACRYEGMQKQSATRCICARGTVFVPGRGCMERKRKLVCEFPLIPNPVTGECMKIKIKRGEKIDRQEKCFDDNIPVPCP